MPIFLINFASKLLDDLLYGTKDEKVCAIVCVVFFSVLLVILIALLILFGGNL